MRPLFLSLTLACLCAVSSAQKADTVLLKNGDRITGKILNLKGGKLVVQTDAAGKVTLEWTKVKGLDSASPIELVLQDGTRLKRKVAPGAEGNLKLEGGTLGLPSVPMNLVTGINPPPKPPVKWTGNVNLGATKTAGNSNNTSVSATMDAVRRSSIDRFTFGAGWLYTEQKNQTTKKKDITERRTYVGLKYDYFVAKRWYLNANTKAENSKASDLDLRYTVGAGAGYQFYEEPDFSLNGELGLGYFYEKFRNESSQDHVTLRAASNLAWKLTADLGYNHLVEWYPSTEKFSDMLIHYDGRMTASLTKSMFLQFQLLWDWDSTPAQGQRRSDTTYILSIGWSF